MNLLEKALEYIFLPCCGICGKLGGGYLCKECGKELKKYEICLKTVNAGTERLHVFKYEDLIRDLIIDYKFNNKSYLFKTFCEFITKNKKIFDFIQSYDIIIPVPIHKKRYKTRGYNQSELISRELAHMCQVKCYTDVLIKMVNNQVQSTLNKNERLENVKDVYKLIKPEKINNKNVLIFDDIYTTGSTVMSCAKELEKAHVEKIGILTLAKD